jgi:hypothetical protein
MRIATSLALSVLLIGSATAEELIHATLYAMPDCDCCIPHAEYLRANGFDVEVIEPEDLTPIRLAQSVPPVMEGCHPILVEGFVVEGHVSADIIKRLLSERPAGVHGISIPGMPTGVPGMPGPRDHPIDVYAFGTDKPTVFAEQD